MRKLVILSFLTICLLLLAQTAFVLAATLTREFREVAHSYSPTDKRFSFDVIAAIETEPDGSWYIGNTYQMIYTIRLSYVNETLYDIDSFELQCYDFTANPYQTDVTFQNSGTLTFNFTAKAGIGNDEIDQAFATKVYNEGRIITSGSWFPSMLDEPIHVNIVNMPTPEPSNPAGIEPLFVVAMIFLFLLILVAVGVTAYKKGKKKRLK